MKWWAQWSMVQGTVEAIWALGLGGSRLYISTFCLPVIRPRRSRAVLSILLCSALSSTASTPHLEPLRAWWQQGITSIRVNKAGLDGRLSYVTIHMVPAMDLTSASSCSQTKYPGTGQGDSTCQGPFPSRILGKVASHLGPLHCTQLPLNLPVPLCATMLQAIGNKNLKLMLPKLALGGLQHSPCIISLQVQRLSKARMQCGHRQAMPFGPCYQRRSLASFYLAAWT